MPSILPKMRDERSENPVTPSRSAAGPNGWFMNSTTSRLSPSRFGFAFGATGVVFYFGCMLTMATLPRAQTIVLFNSLLHGFDIGPILREHVPPLDVALGIVATFVLGWLAGALFALCYNLTARRKSPD